MTGSTGIALQNRGASFVTEPGHPNCIGPGKRPLHTIIPAMVRRDGRIAMSFGVMGGAYQPMGHVAVVAQSAMSTAWTRRRRSIFPRLAAHGRVESRTRYRARSLAGLEGKGHRLAPSNEPLGGGQVIEIDHESGVLAGGSDFARMASRSAIEHRVSRLFTIPRLA